MKKHFILTCLAYFYFGFGLAVEQFGIKAGLGLWPCVIIFCSSIIFLFIVALISMEKVKSVLFDKKSISENQTS